MDSAITLALHGVADARPWLGNLAVLLAGYGSASRLSDLSRYGQSLAEC